MKFIRDHFIELILALVSIFLLILLVAPYWFGYRMQSSYESFIELFSAQSEYSYEVISFDKNWFSSNANLMIKDNKNNPILFFKHQIIHGPIYLGRMLQGKSPFVDLVIKGDIVAAKGADNLFSKLLILSKQSIKLDAAIKMNGDAEMSIQIPLLNEKISEKQFKISPSTLRIQYHASENRYVGDIKIKHINIQTDSVFEISKLILLFDQTKVDGKLTGDVIVSIDSLKSKYGDRIFTLKQASSRISNSKIGQLLDLKSNINISTVNLFNEQLNTVAMDATFNHVIYDNLIGLLVNLSNDVHYTYKDYLEVLTSIDVKSFSFFTERGALSSNMVLHNSIPSENKDIFSPTTLIKSLNIEVTDIVLKKLYEIFVERFYINAKSSDLFVDNMLQLNYIERVDSKLKLRMKALEDKYLINDLHIPYIDFEQNLNTSVFAE